MWSRGEVRSRGRPWGPLTGATHEEFCCKSRRGMDGIRELKKKKTDDTKAYLYIYGGDVLKGRD